MFRFAIGNLLSRPLRTALAMLGLAIAIGGMVGLFAIAGGIDFVVRRTFEQIPGLVVQQRGAPVPLFSTLPSEWGDELRSQAGVRVVDPQVVGWVNELDHKTVLSPPRFLVGSDIPARRQLRRDIYRENMTEGRYLDEEDIGTNACVISTQIARKVRKGVGETVAVNRAPFVIVGIYETGSLMLDGNILADIGTVRRVARIPEEKVSAFYIEPQEDADTDQLKDRIETAFRDRDFEAWQTPAFLGAAGGSQNPLSALVRSLDQTLRLEIEPGEPDSGSAVPARESAIEVRASEDWSERLGKFTGDLDLMLLLVTAIGVLVAILSIVNTMMMSVTERTTEFGILRANGWSQLQIVRLMTFESGLLGIAGGLAGVTGGWLGTLIVNWYWPDRVHLYASPGLLLFALMFSTAIGILGGLYPAWSAARLSPMESIRRG